MNIFMVYVRDENYYRMLPQELGGSKPGDARIKVMAFSRKKHAGAAVSPTAKSLK